MLNSSKKFTPKKSGEAICSNTKTSYGSPDLMLPKIAYLHPKLPFPFRQKMQIFFYCKIRRERSLLVAQKMSCGHFYIKKGSVVVSAPRLSFSEKLQKSVKILHFSHFGDNFWEIYNCSSMCLLVAKAAPLSSKIQN